MNKATDATGGERTKAPKSERQGSAVSKSRARAFGRDEAAKATNPASDTPKKPARKGALWDAEEAAAVRAEQKRAFIRSVQGLCGHIGGSQLPKPNPVDDLIEHINANHFDEIQREFNDAVQCLRGARAGYFVSSTSNDTFEKLIRGCNEQLGLLIDGRKAALREAPATNSNAPVDKYRKPSYSKPMLDRPDIGGAASEQEQSQFVQLARKIGFAAAGKLLVGAAPPEEQRALITGMAACAREATSPEPPTSRVAMTPQQLAELTADTPLGRLQARYEKRLREIDLPNDKITNAEQVRAAATLVTTYKNLVKQQAKLGLARQPQDERVLRAQRLSVSFYREQKAGHTPRRRGRPPKFPMNALA